MGKGIYINGAAQVSIQEPLSDAWFAEPVWHTEPYVRAVEADYKEFIAPAVSRRMGRILKRAVATSVTALRQGGTEMPDAIITGTGLGCIENTEKFLLAMVRDGEELLQPTNFMNSTHNTISSQVAVHLKCHGYNSTYVHLGVSFESALMDAFMQMRLGRIGSALVGGHDEMTPDYFRMLGRIGYWKERVSSEILAAAETQGSMAGEAAVSFLLGDARTEASMAEVKGVDMLYKPTAERIGAAIDRLLAGAGMSRADVDVVFTGKNGDRDDDAHYAEIVARELPGVPQAWYKHLFGESYTAAACGLYAAATCLREGRIPAFMLQGEDGPQKRMNLQADADGSLIGAKNILLLNHFRATDYSLILISEC